MLENPFSLAGETAIITGGGTGLGLAMAQCLAKQGARVAIVGRRQDVLDNALKEIDNSPIAICADVSYANERELIVKTANEKFGKSASILINNAGINAKKSAEEFSDDEMNNMLNIHVTASFALAKLVYPAMKAKQRGTIINIASMASFVGIPKVVTYSCAKSAILGLTRTLASDWAKDGIRVNAIAPGFIYSEMSVIALDSDPERKNKILGRIMSGQRGSAEDIGWAAVYLCSPAGRYINGTTLPIDDGYIVAF